MASSGSTTGAPTARKVGTTAMRSSFMRTGRSTPHRSQAARSPFVDSSALPRPVACAHLETEAVSQHLVLDLSLSQHEDAVMGEVTGKRSVAEAMVGSYGVLEAKAIAGRMHAFRA